MNRHDKGVATCYRLGIIVLQIAAIGLLAGCAKDLFVDLGQGDSITLASVGNYFDCDDPAFAKIEKVRQQTLQFAAGSSIRLCSARRTAPVGQSEIQTRDQSRPIQDSQTNSTGGGTSAISLVLPGDGRGSTGSTLGGSGPAPATDPMSRSDSKESARQAPGDVLGRIEASQATGMPTKNAMNHLLREWWRENAARRAERYAYEYTDSRCLSVPVFRSADSRSRATLPLASHADFVVDNASPARRQLLRKLDALVVAGLLERSNATTTIAGESKAVLRYNATSAGWAAQPQGRRNGDLFYCLTYGSVDFISVDRIEQWDIGRNPDSPVYVVTFRLGIRSEADLAPWAKRSEVQEEFPEIRQLLHGIENTWLITRSGDAWIDYNTRTLLKSGANAAIPRGHGPAAKPVDHSGQLVEEVRKIIEKQHGVGGHYPPWPMPCLNLPGSSKLPVDKLVKTENPYRYAVTIIRKDRDAHDSIGNKTIPYINLMERLGLMRKVADSLPGTDVYELTATYENRIDKFLDCFLLTEPKVEFVGVQVSTGGTDGSTERMFRYKIRIMFNGRPQWMDSEGMKASWPDLKGATERGMACEGEFYYKPGNLDSASGGTGSCWWAFDSYDENH